MKFTFDKRLIRTQIEAKNSEEVIHFIAQPLIEQGYVGEDYPMKVIQREKKYPTGLMTRGAIIAMPHTFAEDVTSNHIAIGVLKKPVMFYNMENTEQALPVQIVFMLAIGNVNDHLGMLQILMQMFKEEALLKNIAQETSSTKICDMLKEYIHTQK